MQQEVLEFTMRQKVLNKIKQLTPTRKPPYYKVSYSQAGEDILIDYIFKARKIANPSYLDIGAHHPKMFSNTALFYSRGSRGINIEPDPILFQAFEKDRKKDINLNIGIANQASVLDFYQFNAATLNTFSKEEAERMQVEEGIELQNVIKIPVDTLNNVLKKNYGGKIPDFISLDVEGLDLAILKSIDFNQHRPKVICVETISYSTVGRGVKSNEIIDFVCSKGYINYADTNINTIFVREDFWVI